MRNTVYGLILVLLCICMSTICTVEECAALTPVAGFSATPTVWSAPATVTFTDNSTGSITSWAWSFGDGAQSDVKNPIHIYEQPGKYTVSLTVTSADGTDTKVQTDYITVEEHVPVGTEHLLRLDTAAHKKFGLYYPVTYKFRLPAGAASLSAQYRYWEGTWNPLPEMHRGDNFNGVDAVRFDYEAGFAYISASFSRASDSLYLRVLDAAGQPLALTFDSIPKFYDERKTAVTITLDDWDAASDSYIRAATDLLAASNLYFSVGLIAKSVPWSSVQQKINEHGDFMEIASHSVDHVCNATDYATYGYDTEATGSRDAIRKNLTFKAHPYVPLYIEPCGYSDSNLQSALTAADYLLTRCSNDYIPSGARFISWDATQGRYARGALTFTDIRYNDGDITLLNDANRIFNDALTGGTIYHLVDHSWKGFWYPNSYLMQHLDYVKGRSDVWYVPFGHMYQYHFLQERRGNLTIQPLTATAAVASFSAAPLAGTAPLTVTFKDTSTGTITGWLWDFGDATTSTVQNPVHVYNTAGTFTVKLTVSGPAGSSTKSQIGCVTISPAAPATVTMTLPVNAASYTVPATVTMTANATAGTGAEVKQVDFYAGSTLVGTATSAPYSVSWNDVAAGEYSLTAKVTDSMGGTAVSNPVGISVIAKVAPTINVTAPVTGASFIAPASLSISASATAGTGAEVKQVEFYAGTTLVGTATSAPYSVSWNDVAAGEYSLTAKVTDSMGGTAVSNPVAISVIAKVAPTINVTAPVTGASFTAPASVPISASATAGTGATVTRVDFYANDTPVGAVTTTPFVYTWGNVAAGNYSLTARVTDSAGATAISDPVAIIVKTPATPTTVTITTPTEGTSFTAPAKISINATATAGNGATITKVEFTANNVLIGIASTAPYSLTWNRIAAGTYALTAKATDSTGGTATSPPVTVTVGAAAAGIPDLTITKTHRGNFRTGQSGSYVITVTNKGTGATTAAVTVTDTLPAGLAATSISGSGWTCSTIDAAPLSCTRSDTLAAGSSFPPINVTVRVTATAPSSVINSAAVYGGGDQSTANNTANDVTLIR